MGISIYEANREVDQAPYFMFYSICCTRVASKRAMGIRSRSNGRLQHSQTKTQSGAGAKFRAGENPNHQLQPTDQRFQLRWPPRPTQSFNGLKGTPPAFGFVI